MARLKPQAVLVRGVLRAEPLYAVGRPRRGVAQALEFPLAVAFCDGEWRAWVAADWSGTVILVLPMVRIVAREETTGGWRAKRVMLRGSAMVIAPVAATRAWRGCSSARIALHSVTLDRE